MRVARHWGLCESNAVCEGIAPHVFTVGEDDQLTVHVDEVSGDDRPLDPKRGPGMSEEQGLPSLNRRPTPLRTPPISHNRRSRFAAPVSGSRWS